MNFINRNEIKTRNDKLNFARFMVLWSTSYCLKISRICRARSRYPKSHSQKTLTLKPVSIFWWCQCRHEDGRKTNQIIRQNHVTSSQESSKIKFFKVSIWSTITGAFLPLADSKDCILLKDHLYVIIKVGRISTQTETHKFSRSIKIFPRLWIILLIWGGFYTPYLVKLAFRKTWYKYSFLTPD